MTRHNAVRAVLFDLGNTLVAYDATAEFPRILRQCLDRRFTWLLGDLGSTLSAYSSRSVAACPDNSATCYHPPHVAQCGRLESLRRERDDAHTSAAARLVSMEHYRVQQIDHVELFVPDRQEAAEWYRRILGLEVLAAYQEWAADPSGPLMISSDGGSTKLALFQGEPFGGRPTAGFHQVAFRVGGKGFLEFVRRLGDLELIDARGALVTANSAVDHGKAYSLYFCDPYGHRLELTTYEHETVRATLQI